MTSIKPRLKTADYVKGVLQGDRIMLGQAITLVESNLLTDQQLAANIIKKIIDHTGRSIRIGITGVPGVGKSTFIESFGLRVISHGKKLAVLTIDPSSKITKGSILGDKTRMESLSKNPLAFIRPSAAGDTQGGVAHKTREALLLCEAAGYDVIIIETVGVGQSEVEVKSMVDFFLLLMLAGAGDELQGIKKGIIEMADAIVITKADGDNIHPAVEAQAAYQQALHLLPISPSRWQPKVLTCSAVTGSGLETIWEMIELYIEQTTASGFFLQNRQQQNVSWFNDNFEQLIKADIEQHLALKKSHLENKVAQQQLSPQAAAQELLEAYYHSMKKF
ncbi:MAG: methylmalonyl Co-A mutase-associated GTPase MeaB [Cyclobacteriaceae bacterium]|nr:methylmalonyl Co-A mutase-associated GTPase MeaB [Cyclobacteriaceae bacterium]